MELRDKKVIVTGGANGIGRCLIGKLVDENTILGVFDINQEAIDKLKKDYPAIFCKNCDVSDPKQVEEAVDDFYGITGAIDVLVNNAGIIHSSPLVSIEKGKIVKYDIDKWDKVISVNLSSVFYVTSQIVQKMVMKRTRGVIVNVSSICAAGNIGQSAYSAAKAGVSALTVTWAKELSLWGIRVAGIAPGFTQTETAVGSMSETNWDDWKKKTPLRRMATPGEIADGILFLIKNDFFNGRILELDGGLRI
ncbi:MAG: SDR family NAD(P)-dependent oxidoreductase [Thermodesulfobacteriota bacterium]|jgi:3-oxoacyl-[acyl-carrier protein] reductase